MTNHLVPSTVTESERERWKTIAVLHALTDEGPPIPPAGSRGKYIILIDPQTEKVIEHRLMEVNPGYGRVIFSSAVHLPRNTQAFIGPSHALPTAGQSAYVLVSSTWEALDPNDKECRYYFWIGGARFWEKEDD